MNPHVSGCDRHSEFSTISLMEQTPEGETLGAGGNLRLPLDDRSTRRTGPPCSSVGIRRSRPPLACVPFPYELEDKLSASPPRSSVQATFAELSGADPPIPENTAAWAALAAAANWKSATNTDWLPSLSVAVIR